MTDKGQISPDLQIRAAPNVLSRNADGETVLLEPAGESFFGLNGVGARVFELLAQPRSVADVVDVICAEYSADRDRVADDIANLISQLLDAKLVEVAK